jgi:GNAT superfamily N-acetyltransferase
MKAHRKKLHLDQREDRKMSGLRLRDARDEDRKEIEKVTLSAFREYAALMPAHWDNYRRGILATLADHGPAGQIVAERDGKIVGAILLYPAGTVVTQPDGRFFTRPWPEMRLLAVAPKLRGRGIGVALIRECESRARRSMAKALALHTTDVMSAAVRIYERMGFVRAPELDFHPSDDLTVKGYLLRLDESGP